MKSTNNEQRTTNNQQPTTLNPQITHLPFDSNLFGYAVGKVIITDDWKEDEFELGAKDYQLIYLFSKTPIKFNSSRIQLVDTKMVYEKQIISPVKIPEIKAYQGLLSKELEALAFLSGINSRFKTDTRLQSAEFKKLYRLWIEKAWQTNSILEVPDLQGMATYTIETDIAKVGLIAVSKESQGIGWGKKLMKAVEDKAFSLGTNRMEISTQESNIPACRLYESLGYEPAEKVYVYHFWSGNPEGKFKIFELEI